AAATCSRPTPEHDPAFLHAVPVDSGRARRGQLGTGSFVAFVRRRGGERAAAGWRARNHSPTTAGSAELAASGVRAKVARDTGLDLDLLEQQDVAGAGEIP